MNLNLIEFIINLLILYSFIYTNLGHINEA